MNSSFWIDNLLYLKPQFVVRLAVILITFSHLWYYKALLLHLVSILVDKDWKSTMTEPDYIFLE